MTWLPASSIASDIEHFVVRAALSLSFFCLVPVLLFLLLDISLFLLRLFILTSSDTYVSIKRRLSDPNLHKTFGSFASLSSATNLTILTASAPPQDSEQHAATLSAASDLQRHFSSSLSSISSASSIASSLSSRSLLQNLRELKETIAAVVGLSPKADLPSFKLLQPARPLRHFHDENKLNDDEDDDEDDDDEYIYMNSLSPSRSPCVDAALRSRSASPFALPPAGLRQRQTASFSPVA